VLYRTILVMSVTWVLVTGIILALLVTTSWLGVQRLAPISRHVAYRAELDLFHDALAARFVPRVGANAQDKRFIMETADALESLAADGGGALARPSPGLIREAVDALRGFGADHADSVDTVPGLAKALALIREALTAESSAQQELLGKLAGYSDRQLLASVVLVVVIPVATLAFVLFFRRRVLAPLNDLSYLMGLLARKDYAAATTDQVDPLMGPLFDKYNRMVRRMRDLDAGHSKREDALQQEVDEAARTLIQQQAALARAERMAAIGDVSARLAHDLRNPLSGVLMALTNLRGEVDSEEQRERLGMVIGELERAIRLLNNLVDESRQVPERPERLQVKRVVDDLVKLLRYQLDPKVAVTTNVPEHIYCRLPESGFRHVLLNLVMNAAQAIGEAPGTIEIAAAVKRGHVELSISDDGPGFPQELLRAGVHEHGTWRKGGSGLGLATARRFMLEHGSRLELKQRQEGGAVVAMTLPAEDCDE
jgi:signal transduction histidine kinase